jgi:lipid-A-disaccharide synthase-like uncharacterized protein
MYMVLLFAQGLWIAYAVLKHDFVILICNAASAFITVAILFFGFYYKNREEVNIEPNEQFEVIDPSIAYFRNVL